MIIDFGNCNTIDLKYLPYQLSAIEINILQFYIIETYFKIYNITIFSERIA